MACLPEPVEGAVRTLCEYVGTDFDRSTSVQVAVVEGGHIEVTWEGVEVVDGKRRPVTKTFQVA